MKRFHLLKQTRQTTEYSCGASALQAVMSYWGKDVDKVDLMQLFGTTDERAAQAGTVCTSAYIPLPSIGLREWPWHGGYQHNFIASSAPESLGTA